MASTGKRAPFVLAVHITCPWCGTTGLLNDPEEPVAAQVGDCMICRECKRVGVFELFNVRRPSLVELDRMELSPHHLVHAPAEWQDSEIADGAIERTRSTINAQT